MNKTLRLGILDLKMGNLYSVEKAFSFLGQKSEIIRDPEELKKCNALVLPGVGHFGNAMSYLEKKGWKEPLLSWLKEDKPFLGICLGMQLLFSYSEEGKKEGLGFFKERVYYFTALPKVPHMGWSEVEFSDSYFAELKHCHFYFVHSYYAPVIPETIGFAFYGLKFTAALKKGNCLGVQFHPEKSQKAGLIFLKKALSLFSCASYSKS